MSVCQIEDHFLHPKSQSDGARRILKKEKKKEKKKERMKISAKRMTNTLTKKKKKKKKKEVGKWYQQNLQIRKLAWRHD